MKKNVNKSGIMRCISLQNTHTSVSHSNFSSLVSKHNQTEEQ